ncbi:MAG TPA: hypothetical protein VGO79_09155 [Thermoanaerobaculia bacterium]
MGLAGATAAGWAVSRPVVSGGLTRRERFAWSLASGLLLQAAALLVLLAVGIHPSGAKLLLLEALAAGLALLAYRPGRGTPTASPAAPRLGGPTWLSAALLAVAAAAWLVFSLESLGDGMWATDFLAFWGYKGKIVYLTSELPRRLFQDPALYFAHREYPLLVPLSLASLAAFVGRWHDEALALLYPACALATLCALSGFLERRVSRLAGASAAALAALCAFLYKAGNAGTAEIPFALSLVLAASAALDWLARDEGDDRAAKADAWRLALASLFCATLKQEGSLFVLLLAVVVALRARGPRDARDPAARRRARVGATGLVALAAPAVAHWFLLFALRGNQTRRDFDFTLFEPDRWREIPALFALVAGRFVRIGWAEALVPIAAIVVFFLVTRPGVGEPLLPVFPAQILFYAVAFTVSSFDPLYAIDGAFRRITMSLFPAFTLVLCSREIR